MLWLIPHFVSLHVLRFSFSGPIFLLFFSSTWTKPHHTSRPFHFLSLAPMYTFAFRICQNIMTTHKHTHTHTALTIPLFVFVCEKQIPARTASHIYNPYTQRQQRQQQQLRLRNTFTKTYNSWLFFLRNSRFQNNNIEKHKAKTFFFFILYCRFHLLTVYRFMSFI